MLRGVSVSGSKFWKVGPIMDQKSSPFCVGFAWKQWLASAPVMTKDGPTAAEIYGAAQQLDELPGDQYSGTTVRGGAKALEALGYIKEYRWAYDAATVRDFILTQGTVVFGCNWYSKMTNTSFLNYMKPEGKFVGGHAVLVVGWSDDKEAFRICSSWGTRWGWNGMAWMKFNDFHKLLRDEGEACGAEQTEEKP